MADLTPTQIQQSGNSYINGQPYDASGNLVMSADTLSGTKPLALPNMPTPATPPRGRTAP